MRNDIVNGMIPFDEERDGPVLSEGAGILILESENHARDRGAHVYAEVVGCGTYTCFDQNLVRITEKGYEKAMIKALRSAGISTFSRTYVNAHGIATRLNDRVESRSIGNIFGDEVPVSSFKETIGHAQAAAPAIELIGCILAINKRTIPRTNLMNAAIDCAKLDYVTEERVIELDYIVKNAAGFSGVYQVLY